MHRKMLSYKIQQYFVYCQERNLEAIYYCIMDKINPEC